MGYEELRGVGVEARICHRQDACGVVLHVGVEDIRELVYLLAVGVGAALDDEAGDYPVPLGVGVEAVVCQIDEVFDVHASNVVVEISLDVALVGLDGYGVRSVRIVRASAIAAASTEKCDCGSACNQRRSLQYVRHAQRFLRQLELRFGKCIDPPADFSSVPR